MSYTIQVLCAAAFTQEKEDLRSVEAQILTKRAELAKFETEYREVLVQFTDMTSRYAQEMQSVSLLFKTSARGVTMSKLYQILRLNLASSMILLCAFLQIDELLKQRNEIHSAYTTIPLMKRSSSKSRLRKSRFKKAASEAPAPTEQEEDEEEEEEEEESSRQKNKKPSTCDKSETLKKKSKWFNLHLKLDKKKPC